MNDRLPESAERSPSFAVPQNPQSAAETAPKTPETAQNNANVQNAAQPQPAPAAGAAPHTPPRYDTRPPEPPFTVRRAEVAAALLSYPLAFLYARMLFIAGEGWETLLLIFTVLFLIAVELFSRRMGKPKASSESNFWAACMLVIAVSIRLWGSRTTGGWDLFLLHGTAAYWALGRAGALFEGRTGPLLPADLGRTFFTLPFGSFFLRIRTLWQGLRGKKWGRQAGVLLATLLVVSPALLLAAQLLAGADNLFHAQLRGILDWVEGLFSAQGVWCFLLSLPVGCYLYGLTAGALRKPAPAKTAKEVRAAAERCRCVPPLAVGAAMAVFCALYLLFFALQARYLFGAFTGVLPEGFTASQYAVQGFWQLCQVVLLNFAVLTAAAKFSSQPLRSLPGLKVLALLLTGSSALFVVIAASKMGLYIRRFGLTPSRLLASWFMVVLAVWVTLAIVSICRPFGAVRWGVLAAAGLFALLCIAKPDGIVVRTNLALYEADVTRDLDVDTLRWCGAAEDLGSFVRRLDRAGWFAGRSEAELREALGAPDEAVPSEGGHRLTWELGMNLIDPEWFVVTTAPDEDNTLRVRTAGIVQG